ncbi:MAG TPA: glycosyl hydrolase [Pirellulales bacterium]|jgi:beta-mannanase|nr:glycosyl hydrolase [Pirellulales bacterium]
MLTLLCGLIVFGGRADPAAPEEVVRQIAVGIYFNEGRLYCPADEQAFADLQQQSGRLAKVYMNFQNWSGEWTQFSTRLADNSLKHGGVFMVVWTPSGSKLEGQADSDWTCAAVAAGKHDDYIKRYAADVAKWSGPHRKPLMIRFAHEMNGGWYPWGVAFEKDGRRHNGNTPVDYVTMWRHVRGIFKEAGANNVTWVWSPNILFINQNNSQEQAKADYAALYPGDDFVDWIGLDGYNNGLKAKWKTFAELYEPSYRAINMISGKPLMIAEFGCSEKRAPTGTSKAAWIAKAYADIPLQFPRVRLVNWFNRDKTKQGETDWRFNSSPEALEAYRAAVNSPLYQGDVKLEP